MGGAGLRRAALVGALVLGASSCTGAHPPERHKALVVHAVGRAPRACPLQTFELQQSTPKPFGQAASVVQGHLPRQLPKGFGLAQVAAVQPHDAGYVAWTDSACRRISVLYEPGVMTASGGVHAFGPWMKLQNCGTPRPCLVYQGAVGRGLVELATWGLDTRMATSVLRSIRT